MSSNTTHVRIIIDQELTNQILLLCRDLGFVRFMHQMFQHQENQNQCLSILSNAFQHGTLNCQTFLKSVGFQVVIFKMLLAGGFTETQKVQLGIILKYLDFEQENTYISI